MYITEWKTSILKGLILYDSNYDILENLKLRTQKKSKVYSGINNVDDKNSGDFDACKKKKKKLLWPS